MPSLIDPLLEALTERHGSDLLLQTGSEPVMRVDGSLVRLERAPLSDGEIRGIVSEVVTPSQLRSLEEDRTLDFALSWRDGVRLRANAFYQRDTLSAAFRMLPKIIPSMVDLGLPLVAQGFVELPRGLVLVTGPTGSGKSTTMAAMIQAINHERACHIITIEDPIEYQHNNDLALVEQREVGRDAPTFPDALRSIFREDPDVVLIGEMRDLETIAAAITIAETGHLVLATLHTNDSAQTIDRIVDVFPGAQQQQVRTQLANCLSGAIYQQLMPSLGGGRVAAFEVLVATSAIRNLIKEGKSNQIRNILHGSLREGMQTLERSLTELWRDNLITLEDAKARSLYPDEIK
jgi:twitching motility protein PilT